MCIYAYTHGMCISVCAVLGEKNVYMRFCVYAVLRDFRDVYMQFWGCVCVFLNVYMRFGKTKMCICGFVYVQFWKVDIYTEDDRCNVCRTHVVYLKAVLPSLGFRNPVWFLEGRQVHFKNMSLAGTRPINRGNVSLCLVLPCDSEKYDFYLFRCQKNVSASTGWMVHFYKSKHVIAREQIPFAKKIILEHSRVCWTDCCRSQCELGSVLRVLLKADIDLGSNIGFKSRFSGRFKVVFRAFWWSRRIKLGAKCIRNTVLVL